MKSNGKIWYVLLLVLMIASLVVASCGSTPEPTEAPEAKPTEEVKEEQVTIAFSGFSMTNEFWLTLERAAEARAEELGVEFINLTTEVQDAEAQKAAVDTAITQGVDAIIVGAADSRGWDDSFNKAKEAGIPIITVDTGIEHEHVSTLIQTDNLAAARAAGKWIAEQTGGEGKALVIGGSVGHQTGDARKQGVEEELMAAGMEVIGDWSDWDENKSAEITQNVLTANPDVVAVFVAFDPGAVAALSVIKQKGLVDQITLVGFDGLPVALKAIKAGEMAASMAQNPARMGSEGVDLALKVINGETVPEFIPIDGVLITADNVDEFLTEGDEEELSGKAPEDMTIAFSGFSMTNEFWLTLERAAEARAEELGVEFINLTTEVQDAEAQKAAVDTAITQGVDAIIVGAADSRGWDDSFNKARDAGIPIITVDTGIEHEWVSTLIQTDNLAAARAAGKWIAEQTGGEGKALVIGGSVGHQTGDARKTGVEEELIAAGMEVIGDWSDWDENKSAEITQNTLTANPDTVAVFVAFDPGAVAALSVIKQKGLVDQITLVGFDGLPVALKAIKAGEMAASMAQNPARMGSEGVDLAVKVVQGEEVPEFIPIDGVLITIDNVDQFLAGEEEPSSEIPEGLTIAFSGFSMTNEFWLTLERAAEARAEELGVEFINLTTEVQDAEAQKAAVDTAITQGVDAIIVGAADSRGWDDSFNKAKEAGIPIITVDTGIEHDWVSTLIQTDNLAAARAAGKWIAEQTGGEGKALVIGGSVGHQTGDARKNGVEEELIAAGMEVIGDWSDWDENKSAEITQNVLTANPDVVVVFVAFDPGAVAALSVIKQKDLVDQITLVGFDGLPVALKAIKAGEMAASMAQNPARMGSEGVDLAVAVIMGEDVPDFIPIDGVLITIDNVDEFLTE